jgi:hypothetical protein
MGHCPPQLWSLMISTSPRLVSHCFERRLIAVTLSDDTLESCLCTIQHGSQMDDNLLCGRSINPCLPGRLRIDTRCPLLLRSLHAFLSFEPVLSRTPKGRSPAWARFGLEAYPHCVGG